MERGSCGEGARLRGWVRGRKWLGKECLVGGLGGKGVGLGEAGRWG
jgi:hypothetical protein